MRRDKTALEGLYEVCQAKGVECNSNGASWRTSADTSRFPKQREAILATPRHYQDYLRLLVANLQPKVIVETGVDVGISTANILAVLRDESTLISIDHTISVSLLTATIPEIRRRNWIPVTLPSDLGLPYVQKLGIKPDLFLHDSDHGYECQSYEYAWAWENTDEGALICSDDYTWAEHGAWAEFCKKVNHRFWSLGNMAVMVKGVP